MLISPGPERNTHCRITRMRDHPALDLILLRGKRGAEEEGKEEGQEGCCNEVYAMATLYDLPTRASRMDL